MLQHSKLKSSIYHLYPGVLITLFFIITAPYLIKKGLPPQLSMLLAIVFIVTPVIIMHLVRAKSQEKVRRLRDLIAYKEKLSNKKLILYTVGLVIFAYVIYGLTQPLNELITE